MDCPFCPIDNKCLNKHCSYTKFIYKEQDDTAIEIVDFSGQRFGRLVAIDASCDGNQLMWKCKCDCGHVVMVQFELLENGTMQSCGCSEEDKKAKGRKE